MPEENMYMEFQFISVNFTFHQGKEDAVLSLQW